MAADGRDEIRGRLRIYKACSSPDFHNDGCKQAILLAGGLRSDTLGKVIWEHLALCRSFGLVLVFDFNKNKSIKLQPNVALLCCNLSYYLVFAL